MPENSIAVRRVVTKCVFAASLVVSSVAVNGAEQPRASALPLAQWRIIRMPWQSEGGGNDLDISPMLHKPAGKLGFVTVGDDGHFRFANGQRAKFWGTAIVERCCCPAQHLAEPVARYLAECGINLVMFSELAYSDDFMGYSRYGDSRHIRAEALDRFDCLFAQLKKHGVYSYIRLLTGRIWLNGDGLPGEPTYAEWRKNTRGRWKWGAGGGKPASLFNRRMIELQKEFATRLLTHRSPYTGLRYVDDPAIALVAATNENSLLQFLWHTLPAPYAQELRRVWRGWLLRKYGSTDAVRAAWAREGSRHAADVDIERGNVPFARNKDALLFAYEIMRKYSREMHEHLRAIGVRVPITANNCCHLSPDIKASEPGDFVETHAYFGLGYDTEPVLVDRVDRMISAITESTVHGRPLVLGETNFPWPNDYRCLGVPFIAGYASLHDMDAVVWFPHSGGYGIRMEDWDRKHRKLWFHSQLPNDPAVWGQMRMGSLAFLGGYVRRSAEAADVHFSQEATFGVPYVSRQYLPVPYQWLPYLMRIERHFWDGSPAPRARMLLESTCTEGEVEADTRDAFGVTLGESPSVLRSLTHELTYDRGKQIFTIDTPRVQGAAGFLGKVEQVQLSDVSVRSKTPYCSVMAVSLDRAALSQSERILISAVSCAKNANENIDKHETGTPPVFFNPVVGSVDLRGAESRKAFALDPATSRRSHAVQLTRSKTGCRLMLEARYGTIYYIVTGVE